MIKQVQDLHAQRHSLEERIKKHEETIDSGIFTTDKEKADAIIQVLRLKVDLENVIVRLTDLANL